MGILFARGLTRQYAKDIPKTPTNEDRLREFRGKAKVELCNSWRWKWHKTTRSN